MDKQFLGKEVVPIFGWTKGVQVEDQALKQLRNVAPMPFIHQHVAVMPDVHWGMGATVGSVIPTIGAIIPAAVGVDIGCGMMAVRTSLRAARPARQPARDPLGHRGGGAARPDRQRRPERPRRMGRDRRHESRGQRSRTELMAAAASDRRQAPDISQGSRACAEPPRHARHRQPLHRALPRRGRGRMGDAALRHRAASATGSAPTSSSGRRQEMRRWFINLPDAGPGLPAGRLGALRRLRRGGALGAGLRAGEPRGDDADASLAVLGTAFPGMLGNVDEVAVNCHHNYVARENHFGKNVWLTRKGAVRAREGRARHHPRLDGRAVVHRARQGQPRSRSAAARTAPAAP